MGVRRLHFISLFFVLLLLFLMSSKRKSSTAKSGPRIKISRSTDDQRPTTHIRNVTLHSLSSGRLTQNVSHTPQTAMFADLPDLLAVEDDEDDEIIDLDVADAGDNGLGGLSDNISSNDPEDDAPGKRESKDSVSPSSIFRCSQF
jgi:hypothetical protein